MGMLFGLVSGFLRVLFAWGTWLVLWLWYRCPSMFFGVGECTNLQFGLVQLLSTLHTTILVMLSLACCNVFVVPVMITFGLFPDGSLIMETLTPR